MIIIRMPRPTLWPPASGLTMGALLAAALVVAPLLSLALNVFVGGSGATWAHLAHTVLPDYVASTLVLCVAVGAGVAAVGVGAAWLVTRHEFAGRATFEWLLVLPLAMPAYVIAYAYTDLLQYVGPVQSALRRTFGWSRADYWFPDVRSLGGAALMFTLVLYPYVYLLARTAFLERAGGMIEVGRSLGLTPWRAFVRLSLPLARPAIAGGVALALMETLADYGTVSYFGVQTFTTGIYRAWFSLGDRVAAAQLSLALLAFVVVVLTLERASRGRSRYADASLRSSNAQRLQLTGVRTALAMLACALPLLLGFVLPALVLAQLAASTPALAAQRFATLAGNSMLVAALTAAAAAAVALLIAYAARAQRGLLMRSAHRIAGFGYALPGSVIAVGVLIPVTRLDHLLAGAWRAWTGLDAGLLFTGGIAALVYACLVRYLTAALQSVDAGLARITPSMDHASRSLGLTAGATLLRVHLPLLRGSVLTAALLVFIDVMKELPATLVMRPFNFDTLATTAYTLASDERLAEAATPALAIVAVGLGPLVVLCRRIARGAAAPHA